MSSAKVNQLKEFRLLKDVDESFLVNVIFFTLMSGRRGAETGFFITNDSVYSIGSNVCGRLGIGHINREEWEKSFDKPLKIDALCGKSIKEIQGGVNFLMALSSNGNLYSWVENNLGQLGHGSTSPPVYNAYTPTEISGLKDHNIIHVSVGQAHTLALSSEGTVFSWGYNNRGQVGNGNLENQFTPFKLDLEYFGGSPVVSVASGADFSAAVTQNGHVFIWGENGFENLFPGLRGDGTDETKILKPTLVEFPESNTKITKIVCGSRHILALTAEGDLYTWGHNSGGELGDGTESSRNIPMKIPFNEPIMDIAAVWNSRLSVCKTKCSENVYVWGQITDHQKDETIAQKEPLETEFAEMQDVFPNSSKDWNKFAAKTVCPFLKFSE